MAEKDCDQGGCNNIDRILIELEKVNSKLDDQSLKFRLIWHGNGDIGYKDRIQRMWEVFLSNQEEKQRERIDAMWKDYMIMKKSRHSMIEHTFKAVVLILITFIAVKLGLK